MSGSEWFALASTGFLLLVLWWCAKVGRHEVGGESR